MEGGFNYELSENHYGLAFSHTTNEQNYLVDNAEGVEGIASDENLSKQKMLAAFMGYSKTFGKWNFNVGLRYEHVALNYFVNDAKMDGQSRSYSNLFPTAAVSYRSENIQTSLSYRSTTQRPSYGLGVSKEYLSLGEPAQDYGKPFVYYSLQNTFKLPAGFTLMLDVQGNTRGHSTQDYIYDSFMMNARLTKTCMNGNLVFNLRGTDILGTYRQKAITELYPVKMLLKKDTDTRGVEFSVRYKFNATKSKYKGESASEEERRRM